MINKLFEPISIGRLQLKNRIMMTAMAPVFRTETGGVSQRLIDYLVERAKGGVGLIELEGAEVDTRYGMWGPGAAIFDSDNYIPGYNDLVESVHVYGAKVSIELYMSGPNAHLATLGGKPPVSASAMETARYPGVIARALEINEIDEIVEAFAETARRAKDAGFDMVQIICQGGYLIDTFTFPLYNKRTDEYGGSLENRLRFTLRIIRRIKEKLGEDFPLMYGINCDQYTEGGATIDDAKEMVPLLEEAGVDAFRVSRTTWDTYAYLIPPACFPKGCFVHHSEELKKVVKRAKVEAEGKITPQLAEDILQANKADLIGFGRAFIADPEWPKKAAEGRFDEIRKCIACCRCSERIFNTLPVKCSVNAAVGHERDYKLTPAERVKKVVIVGGGPAGMEAARVAAIRGHEVVLFEKDNKLGGQLNLACVAPYKEEMRTIIEYLTHQVTKLGVNIRLGEEVTPDKIEEIGSEVVIIATGAMPLVPKVPGIERGNVLLAWDVLSNGMKVGDKVVVVGGGMVGCETAEFLVSKGKKVTIVEMLPDIAHDVEEYTRIFLLERLNNSGVQILTKAKLEEIIDKGIIYSENSTRKTIEADTVVLALGSVSSKGLMTELKGKVPELYSAGDCVEPSKLLEAIEAGFHQGRLI